MSFKVCTIGCGGMSSRGHGPSYLKYAATHPEVEFASCCDLDVVKASAYRDKFGFRRHDTDFEAMLDRERPDAVCLIVPIPHTCAVGCRVLELGYPLFLEKPPGDDVAETDRLIAAAERSGVPTQVAFNRRHAPLIRELKRLLEETGGVGDIQRIVCEMTRVRRCEPDFSMTAIHGIDWVRFLAGSDYSEVQFRYQPLPEYGPTVANVYLDAVMESGAVAHLAFTPVVGLVTERATVHAGDHTFYLNIPVWDNFDSPGRLMHFYRDELRVDRSGAEISDGPRMFEESGFYAENAAFFDALQSGRRPTPDLREARQSVAVAQCTRERAEAYRAD